MGGAQQDVVAVRQVVSGDCSSVDLDAICRAQVDDLEASVRPSDLGVGPAHVRVADDDAARATSPQRGRRVSDEMPLTAKLEPELRLRGGCTDGLGGENLGAADTRKRCVGGGRRDGGRLLRASVGQPATTLDAEPRPVFAID